MPERWFGATGRCVPAIALDGSVDVAGALVLSGVDDVGALRWAHADGVPGAVRASDAAGVVRAPARAEMACALVFDPALLDADLAELTDG